MRTTVIVFFCLVIGAFAGLVHITDNLGGRASYEIRDYIFDDIVFDVNQNFNNISGSNVAIYARSITIPSGVTISARGTGALGGGGGGGGGGRDGTDGAGDGGRGGSPGGHDGSPGDFGGDHGNGGAGGAGGPGRTYEAYRNTSGYPYSELVYKGDGGDGGRGGKGGGGKTRPSHDEEGAGGGGGGGGGNGGGCISLFAANRIFVGGRISSEGGAGGAGGNKGSRTGGVLVYGGDGGNGGSSGQAGGSGGKGYDGDSEDKTEEDGNDGKTGLPGDILLACYSGDIEVHGALFANTVKVFYGGVYTNTGGGAGTATVWTNTSVVVTNWTYATEPDFLSIPVLYANQPARAAAVTSNGADYIVLAKYTNTFTLFTTNDVAPPRGDGTTTNVTIVTGLRFVVPISTGDTSTREFTNGMPSGMSYSSAYKNGFKGTTAHPGTTNSYWYMTNSAQAYAQTNTGFYRTITNVHGSASGGRSVCATTRRTMTGPSSITITVNNSTRTATVPALTNFWLFPPAMFQYDDSVPAGSRTNRTIVTNTWKVDTNYIKKMNGYRPRQSWQSHSTREWPMPNQNSGWQ